MNTYIDAASEDQALDINVVLHKVANDRHLYVCGPNGFMDFVTDAAHNNGWQAQCIHLERFGAELDTDGETFTVVAQKSGKRFDVNPGETINEKLAANGIDVPVSCQSGVCGTCLTKVIKGVPDHRDFVQTDYEKASNEKITVCCSRSKTSMLILDV